MFENYLTHGFLVDDVDAATAYYEKTLGYTVSRRTPTFAKLETGSKSGFFFWQYAHIAAHVGERAAKHIRHRVLSAILYDSRKQVNEAYETLVQRGVKIVAAPREWEWNAYAAYFVDDDGYLWELWTWN